MKPLILLSIIFNLGCAAIQRPDTNLGVINAPNQVWKYYNLKTDYDDAGNRLPSAPAKYKQLRTLDDVNKFVCTDANGFQNLLAYIEQLKQRAAQTCKQ